MQDVPPQTPQQLLLSGQVPQQRAQNQPDWGTVSAFPPKPSSWYKENHFPSPGRRNIRNHPPALGTVCKHSQGRAGQGCSAEPGVQSTPSLGSPAASALCSCRDMRRGHHRWARAGEQLESLMHHRRMLCPGQLCPWKTTKLPQPNCPCVIACVIRKTKR